MKQRSESIKSLYVAFANGIMLLMSVAFFAWRWFDSISHLMDRSFRGKGNLMLLIFYVAIAVICMRMLKGFALGRERLTRLVASQAIALILTFTMIYFILGLLVGHIGLMSSLLKECLLMLGVNLALYIVLDVVFVNIYVRLFPPYRIISVNGNHENSLLRKMESRVDKYHIEKEVSADVPYEDLEKLFFQYDAILVNDVPLELERRIVKFGYAHSKRVYFTPKISDILVRGADEINFFDTPLYLNRNRGISADQRIVKRCFDIVASLLALIVLSPLFLVVALAIKIEDGGPVFYRQERVTFRKRHFMILKFRSMIVDAEKDGKSIPAAEGDPRITKVGRVIRALRIDELPQLVNILVGEMSVVGPRPERVEHMEKYALEIPEFDYRLKVKGGLTGYAQVYGKYNTTAYDKLKMDLMYITNYSFSLDIQIIFETIKILFRKESTEGFSEEQSKKITEMDNE